MNYSNDFRWFAKPAVLDSKLFLDSLRLDSAIGTARRTVVRYGYRLMAVITL